MKESRVRSALEAIARREVPENATIWPAIDARLKKGVFIMRLQSKWSWSVALVLLAMLLLTTVAYALYRYLNDPGLRSAQEAGLISDVNTTAEPNQLTPAPAFASGSGAAVMVGSTETHQGVTLVLDWVYIEDARQAFELTASGLADDMRLGMPSLTFSGTVPEWYSGATFSLEGDDTLEGTYLVHQMVRPGGQPGGRVAVQIDIPLVAWNDGKPTPLSTFHFDVPDVEITVPWGGGGSNTYAVEVNGIEMRMQHVIFGSGYTEVRLCYEPPSAGDWEIDNASAGFGDAFPLPGARVAMDAQVRFTNDAGDQCQDVNFPLAAPGKDFGFYVAADGLTVGGTAEKIDSTWQFSTYLPGDLRIGGVASSNAALGTPLASQTIGDLTGTLEWAYIDSNRAAFTVHFSEWREEYVVTDTALLLADGTALNVGANWGPQDADPATMLISLTPVKALNIDHFEGQLTLSLMTSLSAGAPTTEFVFDLDLPVYQAFSMEPMQVRSGGETDMILQSIRMTPSYTVIYLCYPKPSLGDWALGDPVTLQVGEDQTGISEYAMAYDAEYGDTGKGVEPGWKPALMEGRCVKAGFPVGHHDKPETLVLSIDSLQLTMPEVAPESDVKRALEELLREGIDMDWMTFTGDGGGGGGPMYKKLPEGMTEQEAYRRFIEALGYVHEGPWVFTVEINP
jgi:hypothetical protein